MTVPKPVLAAMVVLGLLSCGQQDKASGDKKLWSSEKTRPAWVDQELLPGTGGKYYVGVSEQYASEDSSHNDAQSAALAEAADGIGATAKDEFDKVKADLKLGPNALDASEAALNYVTLLSAAGLKGARVEQFYDERWKSAATGQTYYKTYAKLFIPDASVSGSFGEYLNQKRADIKLTDEQLKLLSSAFNEQWQAGQSEELMKRTHRWSDSLSEELKKVRKLSDSLTEELVKKAKKYKPSDDSLSEELAVKKKRRYKPSDDSLTEEMMKKKGKRYRPSDDSLSEELAKKKRYKPSDDSLSEELAVKKGAKKGHRGVKALADSLSVELKKVRKLSDDLSEGDAGMKKK